jgi:hypothetical protein
VPERRLQMPTFIAHVECSFEAADVKAGGRRLRDLREAALGAGFVLERGQVEPAPPKSDAGPYGWKRYAPGAE